MTDDPVAEWFRDNDPSGGLAGYGPTCAFQSCRWTRTGARSGQDGFLKCPAPG